MSLRILINHLTRMRYPNYCIAGIDIYEKIHYRPKFFKVFGRIKGECLEESGGPLSLGNIIEILQVKPKPEGAQTENVLFKIENVKVIRKVPKAEFWNWLSEVSNDSMDSIIASAANRGGTNIIDAFAP